MRGRITVFQGIVSVPVNDRLIGSMAYDSPGASFQLFADRKPAVYHLRHELEVGERLRGAMKRDRPHGDEVALDRRLEFMLKPKLSCFVHKIERDTGLLCLPELRGVDLQLRRWTDGKDLYWFVLAPQCAL